MMGRAAQGVRILNIERPDILIGIDSVANEDDEAQRINEENSNLVSIAGEFDLDGSDEVIDTGLKDESEDDGNDSTENESDDADE
jgi:hypothetical protein